MMKLAESKRKQNRTKEIRKCERKKRNKTSQRNAIILSHNETRVKTKKKEREKKTLLCQLYTTKFTVKKMFLLLFALLGRRSPVESITLNLFFSLCFDEIEHTEWMLWSNISIWMCIARSQSRQQLTFTRSKHFESKMCTQRKWNFCVFTHTKNVKA